jgi:hypothetical protein
MSRDLTPARLARLKRLGAGLADPCSCVGLRKLQTLRPRDAHEVLARLTPAPRRLAQATIAELLQTSFNHRAMPRTVQQMETVRPARMYSRLALKHLGGTLRPGEVTDETLEELRDSLAAARDSRGNRRASSTINGTVSLVRQVLLDHAVATGAPERLTVRPLGPRHRVGTAKPRRQPGPQVVARLLEHCKPPVAAWVGLVAGCGVTPGRAIELCRGSLDPQRKQLVVPTAHRPGPRAANGPLVVAVPDWVWDLLRRAVPDLDLLPDSAPLFPRRGKPHLPRTVPRRELKRACEEAFGPGAPRLTGMDLRRLYQRMAIGLELPRALVRGTGIVDQVDARGQLVGHGGHAATARLGSAWTELCGTATGAVSRVPRVPRRAPKDVHAWDPERDFEEALPTPATPMPASVRFQEAPPAWAAGHEAARPRGAPSSRSPRGQARAAAQGDPRRPALPAEVGYDDRPAYPPAAAGAAPRDAATERALLQEIQAVREEVCRLSKELPRLRSEVAKEGARASTAGGAANRCERSRENVVSAAAHFQAVRLAEENGLLKGFLVGVGGTKLYEHREEIVAALRAHGLGEGSPLWTDGALLPDLDAEMHPFFGGATGG